MLKPLHEYTCDFCHHIIDGKKDGYLEWLSEQDEQGRRHYRDFKIVHLMSASPLKEGCYHYTNHRDRADMSLDRFEGPRGLSILLSWINPGPIVDPECELPSRIVNYQEFMELIRRLYIPHYEEARHYIPEAYNEGNAGNLGELVSEDLISVIKEYSKNGE